MKSFRRSKPFGDLVRRQLDLFTADERPLLEAIAGALRAYDAAGRSEAEERYADYLDLVGDGRDRLATLREQYAVSLDERTADAYRAAFDGDARRRFPALGLELPDSVWIDEDDP